MKASDIFKANRREYFEQMVASADQRFQRLQAEQDPETSRPYRSWLFRESSSISGAIVLTTQSDLEEFKHSVLYFITEKQAWVCETNFVDPSTYTKIYASSDFPGINEIIQKLADSVSGSDDKKYNSKYMIVAPVKCPPQLDKDEEEVSAFRMS